MIQKLLCFQCGGMIEATFEVKVKGKKATGIWTFSKGVKFIGDREMVCCGKCDVKVDAE